MSDQEFMVAVLQHFWIPQLGNILCCGAQEPWATFKVTSETLSVPRKRYLVATAEFLVSNLRHSLAVLHAKPASLALVHWWL